MSKSAGQLQAFQTRTEAAGGPRVHDFDPKGVNYPLNYWIAVGEFWEAQSQAQSLRLVSGEKLIQRGCGLLANLPEDMMLTTKQGQWIEDAAEYMANRALEGQEPDTVSPADIATLKSCAGIRDRSHEIEFPDDEEKQS